MSRATPKVRNFAERILECESKEHPPAGTSKRAFGAFDKFRPHLATLMGNAGFRALLSRALALASAEVIWLRAVHVKADGSLEGVEDLETKVVRELFAEGRVVLLAQLLGLLVAFIGEKLTVQVAREVWPKVSLNDLNFGEGD